jgi:chromosome partitioning protein
MGPFIIAVANEKGGVAKTTTTLSIGGGLTQMGRKVLLVDLDPQANLTLSLGLDPKVLKRSILNVLFDGKGMEEVTLPSEIENLAIVPSFFDISKMEEDLGSERTDLQKMKMALSSSTADLDFILIDCPPHLGFLTKSALAASHLLIMPTQAEYFSIYALKNMMNLIRQIREQENSDITYKLLLTLFDRRNRIHRSLSDELRQTFGVGVFNTVIEIDTKLRESQVLGLPIIFHSPTSRSALQYMALTQEIFDYAKEKNY